MAPDKHRPDALPAAETALSDVLRDDVTYRTWALTLLEIVSLTVDHYGAIQYNDLIPFLKVLTTGQTYRERIGLWNAKPSSAPVGNCWCINCWRKGLTMSLPIQVAPRRASLMASWRSLVCSPSYS